MNPLLPSRITLSLTALLTLGGSAWGMALLQEGPGPRFQDIPVHEEFDADGDGRLDREERDAARAALAERPKRERRGKRGGPGRGGPGEGANRPRPQANPNALRLAHDDVKQYPKHGLYDRDALHTFFFELDNDDWHEELAAFHGTDVEVPARLTINGELIGEIGLRYRGNTSFDRPEKKSFGVSIDAYDDDLRLDGYRSLNLLNANGDDSMMREVLFSNIAGDRMPAPKANFAKVVVNGVYLGVYGNVQQINKDFTREHYNTSKGVRWKVPPDFDGGGALVYHGDDLERYQRQYELKTNSADEEDWNALIEACRILEETPSEDLEQTLPRHFDIDEILWFLALDNVFMDSDGYYSRGSDYYVYMDPDGIVHLLHYDNNETFGGGRGGPGRGGPAGGAGGGPGGRPGPPPGFGEPPQEP
ncbi:MAG: CotH kinase family protein, partial [Phycisphaerales bacterium]|nr:CotH kinase family protein [Phycisphaerales bacterium]